MSAILLLGDLNFACQENSEAAILTNPEVADKAGEMLHIPGDEIVGAILSETTYTRGEKTGIIGMGIILYISKHVGATKSLKPTKYMQHIPGDDDIVGAILSETT